MEISEAFRINPIRLALNNNVKIRRMKEQHSKPFRNKEELYTGWEFAGDRAEINVKDNRLQLDDKPDGKIRDELKANGFRWSPKALAWQRQLNSNAIHGGCCQQHKATYGRTRNRASRKFQKERQH